MKFAQPLKTGWLIILISFAAALHGCAAKGPATAQQGTLVQINKIEPRDTEGKTEITIEGAEPILQYTSFQLTDPLRMVVDISDADIGKFPDKMNVNLGAIIDIAPSQKDNIARLEIFLAQSVDAKVYQSGGKLIVEFAKPVEEAKTAPEEVAPEPTQEAPKEESLQAKATVVSAIQASAGKEGVKVIITGDGAMLPTAFMVGSKKLVIDIPGVNSRVKPSVIPVRKGGLNRVRVGQHAAPDQKVRVVLDLTRPLEYTVTPEGNTVLIAMQAAALVKPEEKLPQERAASQEQEKPQPIEKEVVQPDQAGAAAAVSQPVEKETVEPEKAVEAVKTVKPVKRELGPLEEELLVGSSKFGGKRISLDLQDADVINVMRLFAEVANLNIVLAPDVKGRVTVRMVNIPWDQAMDVILKMNGLGYALEDNILRIATVSAFTKAAEEERKSAEEERKSKEAKKSAEDLVTRIIPINYANVFDPSPKPGDAPPIENALKKSLSPRGDITADSRTNTLIVKDIARNVEEVVSLIKLLDRPNPQVMIEARIVEASLNFSRDIGVQWGASFKADAAHGNPTGAVFPNSVGVTGGPQMGLTPSNTGNYFVNMPANAGAGLGGGAAGFTFGSISKALNLDLVLSALEATGEGKIISTPRVSALDNREAKIEQGLSIPFSTVDEMGRAVIKFVDAKLSLIVTPHVTPDNKIFIKLAATKNAPDTSLLGASGQPSIRKNEATTEILLADGETAVIGGILVMDRGQSVYKIPFLGDIPLLGWLFQRKTTREEKRELIIFITPRVVRQAVI